METAAVVTPISSAVPSRRQHPFFPHAASRRLPPLRRFTAVVAGTAERPPPPPEGIFSNVPTAELQEKQTKRPPPSRAAVLCNVWENLINTWLERRPLPASVDPGRVLAGNFAPVPEIPPTPCPAVEGAIPACLGGGAYVRNGPNPQHVPPRGPYHLFDGDGMVHSLLLPADGSRRPPVLCSRFVRTNKYAVESDAGAALFPSFFTFHGLAGLGRAALFAARFFTGQLGGADRGLSSGNVSVAFLHDRLYALGEPDLPFALHLSSADGDLSAVGRSSLKRRWPLEGVTAHPCTDPDTGEVFAFRYQPAPPFLTYFRFSKEGKKQPDVPIFSVRRSSLFHDLAITGRYAIFSDVQFAVDYPGIFRGRPLLRMDPRKVPRIGVIPRYATSGEEMMWFDVPGFNALHLLNAWDEQEEGDGDDGGGGGGGGHTVVLVAPNLINVSFFLEETEHLHGCVEMLRIDLRSGVVVRTPLSARSLEMGVINAAYRGKRNRYAYLGLGKAEPIPKMKGVVKLDFEMRAAADCVAACRVYGPGCFGGEPFFVAKDGGAKDEDDGYLVTYVHNETTGKSSFLVMDAKSPELEVVAEVALPQRVPYGFHGIFLTASELARQQVTVHTVS